MCWRKGHFSSTCTEMWANSVWTSGLIHIKFCLNTLNIWYLSAKASQLLVSSESKTLLLATGSNIATLQISCPSTFFPQKNLFVFCKLVCEHFCCCLMVFSCIVSRIHTLLWLHWDTDDKTSDVCIIPVILVTCRISKWFLNSHLLYKLFCPGKFFYCMGFSLLYNPVTSQKNKFSRESGNKEHLVTNSLYTVVFIIFSLSMYIWIGSS